jgi:hydroxymethylpyrimidine pyrophosphatase-like HAD family hydrolase
MLIALDYDDTYTVDPKCWNRVIAILLQAGHKVIVATSRFKLLESEREIIEATGLQVIFCNHNAKSEVLKKLGVFPDVWIDDNPWSIVGVEKT